MVANVPPFSLFLSIIPLITVLIMVLLRARAGCYFAPRQSTGTPFEIASTEIYHPPRCILRAERNQNRRNFGILLVIVVFDSILLYAIVVVIGSVIFVVLSFSASSWRCDFLCNFFIFSFNLTCNFHCHFIVFYFNLTLSFPLSFYRFLCQFWHWRFQFQFDTAISIVILSFSVSILTLSLSLSFSLSLVTAVIVRVLALALAFRQNNSSDGIHTVTQLV